MNKKQSNLDPIKQFLSIDKSKKNLAFFHSQSLEGFKKIIAYDPKQHFICKKAEDIYLLKDFYDQNIKKGRLICGYFSYDLCYELFSLTKIKQKLKDYPYAIFYAYDNWQEFNNKSSIKYEKKRRESSNFQINITKESYKKSFKKIKSYIVEGDIYQVNLTHKLTGETQLSSKDLFLNILNANPVDFSCYLDCQDFQILSASPERFITIKGDQISTYPIKGTVKRGKNMADEKKQKKLLLESEKEEAELNMITDLLRNDLGMISKPGSVKVKGHRILKKFPTVWHTYSHIQGTLDKSNHIIDAILKIIPGGSITGCPKKRAIEIIDEVEKCPRGIYTGNIGYFLPNGDVDLNIAIRTVIKKEDNVELQVGGGIVDDSKLDSEFDETMQKAASFKKIL